MEGRSEVCEERAGVMGRQRAGQAKSRPGPGSSPATACGCPRHQEEGWESSRGAERHREARFLPAQPSLYFSRLGQSKGERVYQSCFSRHHPVASRPQSCVAGPPAGAGHHCSPVQSCPQSPGVPPT